MLELTGARIPSVLWQCLWAWCFGPWVLFRTRKIKDTHYWRIQTQLAVVAGCVSWVERQPTNTDTTQDAWNASLAWLLIWLQLDHGRN